MKAIDETLLLRFASGELAAAEESAVLVQAEIEPCMWRELCLAVVEHRRIAGALDEWASAEATRGEDRAARVKGRRGHWGSAILGVSALAVGVLLGIAGMHFGNARRPMGGMQPVASAVPNVAPSSGPAAKMPRADVLGTPAEANALETLAHVLRLDPLVPESEEAVLRDHGFEVEERPELYVVQARDGTQWAVPVQRAVLHFAKH